MVSYKVAPLVVLRLLLVVRPAFAYLDHVPTPRPTMAPHMQRGVPHAVQALAKATPAPDGRLTMAPHMLWSVQAPTPAPSMPPTPSPTAMPTPSPTPFVATPQICAARLRDRAAKQKCRAFSVDYMAMSCSLPNGQARRLCPWDCGLCGPASGHDRTSDAQNSLHGQKSAEHWEELGKTDDGQKGDWTSCDGAQSSEDCALAMKLMHADIAAR